MKVDDKVDRELHDLAVATRDVAASIDDPVIKLRVYEIADRLQEIARIPA